MEESIMRGMRYTGTQIFDSNKDVRVQIRTTHRVVLDCRAEQLEVEDSRGRFTLDANSPATMVAVVPSDIFIHKRDGSCTRVNVSWGSLTAVGNQIRIVARNAKVSHVEPLPMAV